MADLLTQPNAELRQRHYDDLIATGRQGHWSAWASYSITDQSIANHLRNRAQITAKPVAILNWPNGWYVRLDDGRVLWMQGNFNPRTNCVRLHEGQPLEVVPAAEADRG